MKIPKYLILILFLLPFSVFGALDSTKYRIIKNLNEDWIVYSKKHSTYIYYVPALHSNSHIVNQFIPLQKYKNYILSFEAAPGLGLFFNHRLIYQNTSDTVGQVYLPLKELEEFQQESGQGLVTFYNPDRKLPVNNTHIVYKADLRPVTYAKSDYIIKKRLSRQKINPYVVLFLFGLTLIAILRHRFNKRFEEFLGWKNTLANTWLEEISTINIVSIPLFLIVVLNSIYMAILTSLGGGTYKFMALFGIKPFTGLLGELIICTVLFTMLFFTKYLFLLFVGWIFNLYNIIKIQFLEFLKGFLKLNTIIVATLLLYITAKNTLEFNALHYLGILLTIVLVAVTLRTALLIIKVGSYRNIYLFSYLCTTEIIPLTIIIKIILFRNN